MSAHKDFAWLSASLRLRRRVLLALDDGTLLFDFVTCLEREHVTIGDRRVDIARIVSLSRRAVLHVGSA